MNLKKLREFEADLGHIIIQFLIDIGHNRKRDIPTPDKLMKITSKDRVSANADNEIQASSHRESEAVG
jgi:hypothetical protein